MDIKKYTSPSNCNPCDLSYGIFSKDEVAALDSTLSKGQVLISHVDDGEYSNNIFGNVFSSYTKALEVYEAYLATMESAEQSGYHITLIQEFWQGEPTYLYLGRIHTGYREANVWPRLEGLLTVETLDSEFFGGC